MKRKKAVVIGGGVAGLSAASYLAKGGFEKKTVP
jgi:phytoene dehydrogenase-like protein